MSDLASGTVHLHLDTLGGLAGDMFIAAMLDACPDLIKPAQDVAARIGPGIGLRLTNGHDKGLRGARVVFDFPGAEAAPRHYDDFRRTLIDAAPDEGSRRRALDILERLGVAEARVHGIDLSDVHFHEVADWDSIADILLAGFLLEQAGVSTASASALPVGGGRVQTEHGPLPVPAPATLELLSGAPMVDDGQAGERVTPTGAAIYAHLGPTGHLPAGPWASRGSGYGFGQRALPGMANALRLVFWSSEASDHDRIGVISFAVDDQIPEDLAIGLENIRATEGVVDVLQIGAIGKKSRMTARIEVLCRPDRIEEIAQICFRETTTIGLRMSCDFRAILPRRSETADHEGRSYRVKTVVRPGGTNTSKVESNDLSDIEDASHREALRRTLQG
jgi:uncharacterized protein (TIGR00299 family) protein